MKKRNGLKRVVTFVLAAAMVVTMGFTPTKAYAYEAQYKIMPQIAKDLSGKTLIIQSNDVHGAMDKYSQLAALRNELKARGADVILTDAGDFSQGTPYVSTTKGMYAINMMNAMGYDVVTLGNHEFDFGYEQLKKNLASARFKVVCADVLDKKGNTIVDSNYVFTTPSGLKVGFFGMETPETQTKVNPALIKGIKFLSKGELYTCAQSQVDALKAQGVDLVVCLSHLGVDDESAPDGHRSVDLLAHTSGIDLLLDGHSHTLMTVKDADPTEEGNESAQSTGTKLETAGVVVIDNATKKVEDMYLVKLDDVIIKDTFISAVDKTIESSVDA